MVELICIVFIELIRGGELGELEVVFGVVESFERERVVLFEIYAYCDVVGS